MDEIKVSILVPAYNVEAYAEECLAVWEIIDEASGYRMVS